MAAKVRNIRTTYRIQAQLGPSGAQDTFAFRRKLRLNVPHMFKYRAVHRIGAKAKHKEFRDVISQDQYGNFGGDLYDPCPFYFGI